MTEEVTLAPCPFCGGEAEVYQPHITLGDEDEDVDYLRVLCTNSKCRTIGGLFRFKDHNRQSEDYQNAKQSAIAAWNARANQPPAQDGLVEALRAIEQTPNYRCCAADMRKVARAALASLGEQHD